jgi:tetratricopeptide (TPR) repeat protein
MAKLGQYEKATLLYEQILEARPDDAQILLRYGIALRIVGQSDEAIRAFRQVLNREPENGEAYWNLANLKTFRFEPGDVTAMRLALENDRLELASRVHILFALGKALNDGQQFDEAFQTYHEANELAKGLGQYNPGDTSELVRRCERVFTRSYFEAHKGGCEAPDPIFIVGLPRSGSTLLEQILANHSAIDATMELSEITAMVRSLNNPNRTGASSQYPGILTELQPEELLRLGEEYLKRTRCFRGERRFFIDKAPHNFLHIGLIRSILPNAKIIDARRRPQATGFSIYTQFFARGTSYAYDLEHIGLYYRDYLHLMNHWHSVMPGTVLTVQYEDVVDDMEREVRRMLDYCGLPFESACLEFYKSKRAVATVSSEQVRQPIYDAALEHWKNYEKHLGPLDAALQNGPS